MATKQITFASNLRHVLGFRHGPRAAVPPAGNVWDYYQPVDLVKGPEIARRTTATYFPNLTPAALRCSQIPRSWQTLVYLWPHLASRIKLEPRLGFDVEALPTWKPIDEAFPDNAYDTTPQQQREVMPELVDHCGECFFYSARDLADVVGVGKVGVMCSHVPYADAGARLARQMLCINENDGWLPGKGFGSGAFVHLAFADTGLASCEYYPVPD